MTLFSDIFRYLLTAPFLAAYIYLLTERRFSKKKTVALILCGVLLDDLGVIALRRLWGPDGFPYVRMVFSLLVVQAICFAVCKYRDMRTVFASLTASAFTVVGAMVGGLTHVQYPNSIWANIFLSARVGLLLLLVIQKRFRRPYLEILSQLNRGWISLSAIPLCFLGVYFCLSDSIRSIRTEPRFSLALLFFVAAMFLSYSLMNTLFHHIQEQYAAERNNIFLYLQVRSLQARKEDMRESENRIRIYRHDLRHYTRVVASFLQEGDSAGALEAIRRMDALYEDGPAKKYCLNQTVNATVSYQIQRAERSGVKVTARLDLPKELPVDAMELAVVFANSLENAVNACLAVPEGEKRELLLTSRRSGEQIFIEIANSCYQPVRFDPDLGIPLSQKPGHGFGARSTAAFAQKYGALVDYSCEGRWFRMRLLIPGSAQDPPPGA